MKSHSIPSRGLIAFLAAAPPDVVSNERGDMGPLRELSKHNSRDSRPPPGVVGAAQDVARLVPQGKVLTTDLRSAAQVAGLLRGQVTELLGRAVEVVESTYACPDWMRYGRTERTNETREMLLDAVLSQVAEGGPDEMIAGALPLSEHLRDMTIRLSAGDRCANGCAGRGSGWGRAVESAAGAGSPAALYTIHQLVYNDLACNPIA